MKEDEDFEEELNRPLHIQNTLRKLLFFLSSEKSSKVTITSRVHPQVRDGLDFLVQTRNRKQKRQDTLSEYAAEVLTAHVRQKAE